MDTQEIIEEAAEKYIKELDVQHYISQEDFVLGAKWNQERMYVEADKIMKFLDTEVELKLSDTKTIERIKWYLETFFEQFKKK